jgi:alcohol dehydrogenase class IV
MKFEFASAARIIFGYGTLGEVPALASDMGSRAFVVTGRTSRRAGSLLDDLARQGINCTVFNVPGEPAIDLVRASVAQARQDECDLVVAIGGGSVIDTGKAVAAMLANSGKLEDYLEVVGLGKPLGRRSVPNIAVPTTAGTGAEVTSNAVIGIPEYGVKVSLRSPLMLPGLAVVDPGLTLSVPPSVTAVTGLDALTQLIEAFVSNKANPLTDSICREGITRAGRSLRAAYEDGGNREAREGMALASLFSGLALANAKLGAVHGIAGPLGGMISAPHGGICARLLPYVMEANLRALDSRVPDSPVLARYDEVARLLTGNATASAAEGVGWVQALCASLDVTPLAGYGLKKEDFRSVAGKALKSSSMKGNPVALTDEELIIILEESW